MSDPSAVNDAWPAEKIARLRELVEAGHGSPAIARLMHISRNAVCGKAQRLDLRFKGVAADKMPRAPRKLRKSRAGALTLPEMQRWCAQCGGILGAAQERFCSNGCHLLHLAANRPPVGRKPPASKPPVVEVPRRITGARCEWLEGNKPFRRCEAVAWPGYPYCREHCLRAYINWRGMAVDEVAA